jgi:uncharacterized membrane protein
MKPRNAWFGLLGALSLAGAGYVLARPSMAQPSYAEARALVEKHCVSCHSDRPTVAAFPVAPASVELDTPEQMRAHAARIRVRTAVEKTMPFLNKTAMSDAERRMLAAWVEAGAPVP